MEIRVGSRVVYTGTETYSLRGRSGVVLSIKHDDRIYVRVHFENVEHTDPRTVWVGNVTLLPSTEEELLVSLLNKHITPEEYSSLKGGT